MGRLRQGARAAARRGTLLCVSVFALALSVASMGCSDESNDQARWADVAGPSDGGASFSLFRRRVAHVTVTVDPAQLDVGQNATATATATNSRGDTLTGRSPTWASSAPGVATVTPAGIVTAVSAGTAAIEATVGGVTGSSIVTVLASPAPTATQLRITTQPPDSTASGAVLSPAPVVQLSDSAGGAVRQAGVTIRASVASGTPTLSGTASVTTDANGAASFTNLVLAGDGSSTLRFDATNLTPATSRTITVVDPPAPPADTTGASGTFPAPDIVDNASFETGWDGFVNGSGGTPFGVDRDNTLAHDGSWSVKRSWVPNPGGDGGAQFLAKLGGNRDRVWVRFYMRATAPITTVMKFARFYDSGINTNFGGLFYESGSSILAFGFDREDQAVQFPIGLQESQILDGRWHLIEFDYWRNGDPSGFPSAAFWFDGQPVSKPDGPAGLSAFWKGGRLYAGERKSSGQMAFMEWVGTLNAGNTTTGQINLDEIAISAAGRIGP